MVRPGQPPTTGEAIDTYRPDVGINYTNVAISPDGRLAGTCAGDTRRTATGHEPGGCVYLVEHWPVRACCYIRFAPLSADRRPNRTEIAS